MVFGAYYLTLTIDGAKGEGNVYRHSHEVQAAFDNNDLSLHAKISLRPRQDSPIAERFVAAGLEPNEDGDYAVQTSAGRLFFNEALPGGFRYVNDVVGKRNTPIGVIVEELSAGYPKNTVAASLDRSK